MKLRQAIATCVTAPDARTYTLPGNEQQHYADFFAALSRDFGTRLPHIVGKHTEYPEPTIRWRPLLTENIHAQILVGYGDPAVLKTGKGYLNSAGVAEIKKARRKSGR